MPDRRVGFIDHGYRIAYLPRNLRRAGQRSATRHSHTLPLLKYRRMGSIQYAGRGPGGLGVSAMLRLVMASHELRRAPLTVLTVHGVLSPSREPHRPSSRVSSLATSAPTQAATPPSPDRHHARHKAKGRNDPGE